MVDISRALRHLAWADEIFFTQFAALPEAAMGARYAPDQWPAGHVAAHIIGSASWYRHCLTGEPWLDVRGVRTPDDLGALIPELLAMDATLLAQAELADGPVTFVDEDGERTAMRSTILNQACLHAVEHRAQVSAALAAAGFTPISLDDLDFWAFEEHAPIA